jgi:hypothetical protein
MSSEALVEGRTPSGGVVLAGWETDGQVFYGKIDPTGPNVSPRIAAPSPGKLRKHPALAVNPQGQTLLAWTEGTAWQKGGALAWQVFDQNGQPTGEKGRIDGAVPTWGLAAAYARPDGGFTIVH